jgi:hypothetical protein
MFTGEDHRTVSSEDVRLTHIVIPHLSRPLPPPTHNLLTPDNSDLSAQSSSDIESSTHTLDSDAETETETETESVPDIGYSLTPHDEEQVAVITSQLERVVSVGSSVYASSEGGEGSEYEMLGDSLELPPKGDGAWLKADERNVPRPLMALGKGLGGGGVAKMHLRQGRAWEDKPTFFEYLYSS